MRQTNEKPTRQHRPLHAYLFIALASIAAYILLGLGWIIGAIGDVLWEIGKRLQEERWEIK